MRHLAAILHTHNDGHRLGRCLETLYACDEILVVDRGSTDQTLRIAREYGAKVIGAKSETGSAAYVTSRDAGWILCMDTRESLTEGLAASLYEWKLQHGDSSDPNVLSLFVREETPLGWVEKPEAETRIVPRNWQRWNGQWPLAEDTSVALEGRVLRFSFP